MADTLAPKFRKKLPQSLTNHSLSHSQISYLRHSKLPRTYLLLNLPKIGSEILKEFLKVVQPDAVVDLFADLPVQDEKETKRAAIIRFADDKSEKSYVAEASRKDLNMLNNAVIAKMLLQPLT